MADIKMRVDTALGEVPVNIMPLLDDTDFKTREVAVAYDAGGMDLRWNFVDHNGAFTSTAVTPTTSGDYDWAHQGDGMYSIEIPASGGASINNDTEGFGWFTGVATGVLPWRGPIIQFIPDALADIEDGSASVGTAQTGDAYARLGAPAGASVSADVAAVKVDTAAILVDTGTTLDGRIPAALTANGNMKSDVLRIAGVTVVGAGTSGDKWRA